MKLLISLLAAALTLSACADIPPVKEPVPKEQQVIISPPEGGWTAVELLSHSYVNDVQLEYPLTMRSLGSGFSSMGLYSLHQNYQSGNLWYDLDYEYSYNEVDMPFDLFSVSYGRDVDDPTPDEEISEIRFYSEFISINGVKYSTPVSDIEKYLGKPDDIVENDNGNFVSYIYNDRESGKEQISISFAKEKMTARNIKISLK
ncbi:MAG: hypothetical protein MSJ26_00425 [Oscillospiraceae bacterium]|nr:hypothetical protein [Oscillospiraceae bacterium]